MIATAILALLALLATSVAVAASIIALGLLLGAVYSAFPVHLAMGEVLWSASNSFLLIAIPLFVLIGEILVRAGLAAKMYRAMELWLSWLPGGLLHANIGTATLFSATSGSSVATAAIVGSVAMPQAKELGYDQRLFAGSIAAGGTLGILIPPSISLIIYGFLTQTSVPKLFAAGLLPGFLLALMFMLCTALICIINPKAGGPRRHYDWPMRIRALIHLVPIVVLFGLIVGPIYAGWATPTEGAALGVVGALVIAATIGTLNVRMLIEVLDGTMRTTGMILLIVVAAYYLNYVLAVIGINIRIEEFVRSSGLGPFETLMMVILLYFILGLFIETISLLVITVPIVFPIMMSVGYDPVWFGILVILMIELALITPPVGLNLFVVQSVRTEGKFRDVVVGAIPYVGVMIVAVIGLVVFPEIATFLPGVLD
ncbi:TRAP transporter large permease subunit [Chelativorans sp. ZYF759]|uniref:TRAP transporter large permease n=1 Tax=Chelativorans sp. ZYF759 TaxID=2692213 RepID=UPI00145E3221|nr:TRAP transporter large permease [Chelativorans sp. ZYF759]NMG41469.1 TRAP transporter large permease subunit [Chelativorans sp. ZYF759]